VEACGAHKSPNILFAVKVTPKSHDRNMSPLEVVDLLKINTCAPITQLVECAAVNSSTCTQTRDRKVIGSNPIGSGVCILQTTSIYSSVAERDTCNVEVTGSIPV
jgi:hypothetical protein